MRITTILYFAWLRDTIGVDQEQVEIGDSITTVRDLAVTLSRRSDGHARAFADFDQLRVAVDLAMVGFDSPVAGADEIAFFPPVTGG